MTEKWMKEITKKVRKQVIESMKWYDYYPDRATHKDVMASIDIASEKSLKLADEHFNQVHQKHVHDNIGLLNRCEDAEKEISRLEAENKELSAKVDAQPTICEHCKEAMTEAIPKCRKCNKPMYQPSKLLKTVWYCKECKQKCELVYSDTPRIELKQAIKEVKP